MSKSAAMDKRASFLKALYKLLLKRQSVQALKYQAQAALAAAKLGAPATKLDKAVNTYANIGGKLAKGTAGIVGTAALSLPFISQLYSDKFSDAVGRIGGRALKRAVLPTITTALLRLNKTINNAHLKLKDFTKNTKQLWVDLTAKKILKLTTSGIGGAGKALLPTAQHFAGALAGAGLGGLATNLLVSALFKGKSYNTARNMATLVGAGLGGFGGALAIQKARLAGYLKYPGQVS